MREKMSFKLLCFLWVLWMAVRNCRSDGELNAVDSTSACAGRSVKCANLGNISYPFWDSASCAASPSYVLSNCSSSAYARWDSLSLALQAATEGDAPRPAVIRDLTYLEYGNGIFNLTWDTSPTMNTCDSIFSSHNLSQYNIPASINLTGFANDSFTFSRSDQNGNFDNVYLFFNCTNRAAMSVFINSNSGQSGSWGAMGSQDIWEKESYVCASQKAICTSRLSATSCISLIPYKEVMLQHVMDTMACSHFTFGILSDEFSFLNPGLVQLSWSDECTKCANSWGGGNCIYNGKLINCGCFYNGNLSDCGCFYNGIRLSDCECFFYEETIEPNTQSCLFTGAECYGGVLRCHPILLICICMALSLVAVVLALMGFFRYFGNIKRSFRDLSSKLARLAISVLKKVLRRLQQSTYRPNLSIILRDLEGLTERPVEYSYSSIASATKSFSSAIGKGGFGVVYKGTLPQSGSTQKAERRDIQIAVKVLEMRSKHMKNQFLNEVGTIGRIHHVNVVRLLGFCVQEDHEMLVYEYVANRSLDRWLFAGKDGDSVDEERVLDWSQRYAIAVGVARGLSYLHEECRHRTVHCDIKPQNILLDDAMNPKIADFGLSRLMDRDESQVVTLARGTPGYMAPEFWRGGESRLSTKFDVYSYGMVLLELISGRRNFAYDVALGSVCCFPALAFEATVQGNVAAILDARLGSTMQAYAAHEDADEGQWSQIRTMAFTALWCIQDHPASRPSMSEVVQYLEGTIAVSGNIPRPSISNSTPVIAPFSIQSQHCQDFTPVTIGR